MVLLGNNKSYKIIGVGTIRLKMHDGVEIVLQEVRYVPALKRKLISLGMLNLNGRVFKAENGTLKVIKGSMVVMKGLRHNGLCKLIGSTILESVSTVVNETHKTIL